MTVRYYIKRFFNTTETFDKPARMFSLSHLLLFCTTVFAIGMGIKNTLFLPTDEIRSIVRRIMIVLWTLEIIKITIQLINGNLHNLDTWVPLYFCSIGMYAGMLSCFAHGTLQHIGDVFLATGALVGGLLFICYPSSSLPQYPLFHFISLHSFFYHGCLVYTGVIMIVTHTIDLVFEDIVYYALFAGFFLILAWIINIHAGTNLMFISVPFHGTILDTFYNILKGAYTPILILGQMILPFLGTYTVVSLIYYWMSVGMIHLPSTR